MTDEESLWSRVVCSLLRNRDLAAWNKLAAAISGELERTVSKAQAGADFVGDLGQLESDLIKTRLSAKEETAEKLLDSSAKERQLKTGETYAAAYLAILNERPELYADYQQERADAARGTRYEKSLSVSGTRQREAAERRKRGTK